MENKQELIAQLNDLFNPKSIAIVGLPTRSPKHENMFSIDFIRTNIPPPRHRRDNRGFLPLLDHGGFDLPAGRQVS